MAACCPSCRELGRLVAEYRQTIRERDRLIEGLRRNCEALGRRIDEMSLAADLAEFRRREALR